MTPLIAGSAALFVAMLLVIIRGLAGPTLYDRVLAVNSFGTLTVILIGLLGYLTARPDFLDVFVAIGRLGRSLGIHLVLATQRLEEGRLRGLESHLSWRIALRWFARVTSVGFRKTRWEK